MLSCSVTESEGRGSLVSFSGSLVVAGPSRENKTGAKFTVVPSHQNEQNLFLTILKNVEALFSHTGMLSERTFSHKINIAGLRLFSFSVFDIFQLVLWDLGQDYLARGVG